MDLGRDGGYGNGMRKSLAGATRGRFRPGVLLSVALGCAGLALPWPQPGRATADEPRLPDVVLIVVDTLRADRTRALLRAGRLPFLKRLSARATRFSRVWSPSSWTPTATASIFTGLHPHQHGVRSGYLALSGGERLVPVDRIASQLTTLPMVMGAAGYRTLGVSDNINIGETMGFARGFERFEQRAYEGATWLGRSAARLWRARAADDRRPTFLYLHPMDPHAPYHRRAGYVAPIGPDGDRALARYDSEIVHLDRQLDRLSRRLSLGEHTLVIFTSDHGEAFGEHGQRGHPNQLYDELLSVPLLISIPGQQAQVQVDEPVSTLDILPTLRGLVGLPPGRDDAGMDLRAAMAGAVLPQRALLSMRFSDFVQPPLSRRALILGGLKYIESAPSGRAELYDLTTDPGERHDLSRARPAERRRLSKQLAALLSRGPRFAAERLAVETSPQGEASLLERLRALGYAQ